MFPTMISALLIAMISIGSSTAMSPECQSLSLPSLLSSSYTRWSSIYGSIPNIDHDIIIDNQHIVLDVNDITINGGIEITSSSSLVIPISSSTSPSSYKLRLNHLLVFGEFHIGSEECHSNDNIDIELTSGPPSERHHRMGQKVFGVGENGIVEIHGATGLGKNSWSKLSSTAYAGSTTISLIDNSLTWKNGDVIVLSSTDFNMEQAEQVTINGVLGNGKYSIVPPLKYMHFGAITYGVDERGEVGLLTRNIVIHGSHEGSFGGHTMIVKGFKAVHIEGAEFANMGQASTVGRYPVHFHMCGEVPHGTYVRYSSVHHSHFRCMTIHGTHGVTLQGNVAYDHYGHCFFFEDGVEENNVLDGNLGLVTRRKNVAGPGSNEAGVRSDWEAPSTYWITHPNNVIINNVAGGSAHTGMWYLFRQGPSGLSKLSGLYQSRPSPTSVPLGRHFGNVIHSCDTAGLFLEPTNHNFALDNDGIELHDKSPFDAYHPMIAGVPSTTVFEGDTVYKIRLKGAWFRGLSVWFKDCRFADNQSGLTIASAGGHPDGNGGGLTTGAIFVGWSENKGQDVPGQPPMNVARGCTTPLGPGLPIRGYQFYDGPQTIEDSSFHRFDSDEYAHHSALALFYQNTWQMAVTNGVKHITFDEISNRYWIQAAQAPNYVLRLDGDTNAIVADHLGSVSGYRDSTIINNYPYFTTSNCIARNDWNAAVCPHRYVNVWIENLSSNEAHYQLKELFLPGMSTIRDQHVGDYTSYRQDILGIPQMDQWGNKYRYQVVASPEASYIMDFPHVTPSKLRIQMNNAHVSDGLRYGICYPRGTRINSVVRGLFINNHDRGSRDMGEILGTSSSMSSLPFMSGDQYYWDDERSMLFVTLKQRYDRHQYDSYCPPQGCEQVWIDAIIPPNSGPVKCGDIAYPHYRADDSPFMDRKLQAAIGASSFIGDMENDNNQIENSSLSSSTVESSSPTSPSIVDVSSSLSLSSSSSSSSSRLHRLQRMIQ